jgi:polyisoprenoid-binding protein YceI
MQSERGNRQAVSVMVVVGRVPTPHKENHKMSFLETQPIIRTVRGAEVPAAGPWSIDPGHAEVAFIGRHFMLTKVRGRFTDVTGVVHIGDDPADSTVEVSIAMASVNSGSVERDDHLRSPDFFDVTNHSHATFRSTTVTWKGKNAVVHGDLTICGVGRPVALEVEYLGATTDPSGGERAIFSASTEINREDWGLTWNMALEAGGVLVSKKPLTSRHQPRAIHSFRLGRSAPMLVERP